VSAADDLLKSCTCVTRLHVGSSGFTVVQDYTLVQVGPLWYKTTRRFKWVHCGTRLHVGSSGLPVVKTTRRFKWVHCGTRLHVGSSEFTVLQDYTLVQVSSLWYKTTRRFK
jgi:hypothetical protein